MRNLEEIGFTTPPEEKNISRYFKNKKSRGKANRFSNELVGFMETREISSKYELRPIASERQPWEQRNTLQGYIEECSRCWSLQISERVLNNAREVLKS